jgi:hypothetical protein
VSSFLLLPYSVHSEIVPQSGAHKRSWTYRQSNLQQLLHLTYTVYRSFRGKSSEFKDVCSIGTFDLLSTYRYMTLFPFVHFVEDFKFPVITSFDSRLVLACHPSSVSNVVSKIVCLLHVCPHSPQGLTSPWTYWSCCIEIWRFLRIVTNIFPVQQWLSLLTSTYMNKQTNTHTHTHTHFCIFIKNSKSV